MLKKVTHRMIAGELGVACSSVTRVLTGNSAVSPEMKAMVISAARKLGYHFHGTQTVAVICPAPSPQQIYDIALQKELLDAARKRNIDLIFIPKQCIRMLSRLAPDGVISTAYDIEIEKALAVMENIPLVNINNYSSHIDRIFSICSDDHAALTAVLSELRKLGHRRIAALVQDTSSHNLIQKLRCETARSSGAEVFPLCLENLGEQLNRIRGQGFTAAVIPAEIHPFWIEKMQRTVRFKIPEDFSLILWEPFEWARKLENMPSAYEQNLGKISEEALDTIEKISRDDYEGLTDVRIPFLFHDRRSVGAVPVTERGENSPV